MAVIALIIGVVIAALDQLFKFLVVQNLKPVGTVNVLGDVFKLTYVENRGVAFGMFQGCSGFSLSLPLPCSAY